VLVDVLDSSCIPGNGTLSAKEEIGLSCETFQCSHNHSELSLPLTGRFMFTDSSGVGGSPKMRNSPRQCPRRVRLLHLQFFLLHLFFDTSSTYSLISSIVDSPDYHPNEHAFQE
jgi:hypothetical protein